MLLPKKLNGIFLGPFFVRRARSGLLLGSIDPEIKRHLHFMVREKAVEIHATDETQTRGRRSLYVAKIPIHRLESFFQDIQEQMCAAYLRNLQHVDPAEYARKGFYVHSSRRSAPALLGKVVDFGRRSVRLKTPRWSTTELIESIHQASFPFSDLDGFRDQPPGTVGAWRFDEESNDIEFLTLFYFPNGIIDGRPAGWYASRQETLGFRSVFARTMLEYLTPGFCRNWDELIARAGLSSLLPSSSEMLDRLSTVTADGDAK